MTTQARWLLDRGWEQGIHRRNSRPTQMRDLRRRHRRRLTKRSLVDLAHEW